MPKYMNINKDICFRYISQHSYVSTATANILENRSKPVFRRDAHREDLFIVNPSAEDEELFRGDVGNKILTKWLGEPKKLGSHDRDKEFMSTFLDRSSECKLPKIDNLDLLEYLPGKSPLIAYLKVDSITAEVGYQYPSKNYIDQLAEKCSLDINSLTGIQCKEITLGKSSEEEVRAMTGWIISKLEEDEQKFPAKFCSFDVEEFKIPRDKYDELKTVREGWHNNPVPLIFPVPDFYCKNAVSLPARIIMGNGITWFASIRFNFDIITDSRGVKCYKLSPNPIPMSFLNLLKGIHFLVGQGVINDRNGLENVLYNLYGVKIELTKALEMDAIGAAAGWKLNKSNMFVTNLITMGGLLNKEVSCADQNWCLEWDSLPDEFKIYCIGDVRFGYANYIVLMSLLIRNLFPDIHVLCSTLELRQPEAIQWITSLIGSCISEKNIHPSARREAATRKELVESLRGWDYSKTGRSMQESPSNSIVKLAELIPDWPTVIHGGPRDLHSVLAFFVDQYKVLKELKVYSESGVILPNLVTEINDDFIKKCTFNRGTDRDIFYEAVEDFGLKCKASLEPYIFKLDLNKLMSKDIKSLATQTGQSTVFGVLEVVRLRPKIILPLLYKLDKFDLSHIDYAFWHEKTSLYEMIRLMYESLFNKSAIVVHHIENELYRREENVMNLERDTRIQEERKLENRKRREELYEANRIRNVRGSQNRAAVQQKIYGKVPGDNAIRNRKWRKYKKKVYEKVAKRHDYLPRREWKAKLRAERNESRETNVSDLRQVLNSKRAETVTSETHSIENRVCQSPSCEDQEGPLESSANYSVNPTDEWGYEEKYSKIMFQSKFQTPGYYSPRGTPPRSPSPAEERIIHFRTESPSPGYADYADYPGSSSGRHPLPDDAKKRKGKGKGKNSQPVPRRNLEPGDYYSSESSCDEFNNDFVRSEMMKIGIYPKKKKYRYKRDHTE